MPDPKSLCRTCGVVTTGHYCPQHDRPKRQPAQQVDAFGVRLSSAKRGYGRRWRECRKRYLARFPLCHDCQYRGILRDAEEVHHIKKMAARPDLAYTDSNLMGLCKACHDVRSGKGE